MTHGNNDRFQCTAVTSEGQRCRYIATNFTGKHSLCDMHMRVKLANSAPINRNKQSNNGKR